MIGINRLLEWRGFEGLNHLIVLVWCAHGINPTAFLIAYNHKIP